MLFSPKENGSSLVEVAVIVALLILAFKLIVSFLDAADAQNPCGVFESC